MRRDVFAKRFNRLATGLQIARNQEAYMRFMTLTSAKEQKRPIKKSFAVLRLRIQRATYEKDGFQGFKFNRYFCLRTSEGNGVLHVIFWGRFIPQDWLSRNWQEIHGAFRADIRACFTKYRKVNGLVGYLLTNYLCKQPIERMSYGWKWAWLGFCKSWKRVKEHYGMMRKGTGQFTVPIIRLHGIGVYIRAHERVFSHSIEAWRCTLWCYPMTSRQLKLKGSPNQKYWEKGFDRKKLDLPVKKKPKEKSYRTVEGEVADMLNARSALFRSNVYGGGV